MLTTSLKRGRKIAVFHPRTGEPVTGLMRLKDGRWRASGPEKFTFTEPDEGLAIARFREWQRRRSGVGRPTTHADVGEAVEEIAGRIEAGESVTAHATGSGRDGRILLFGDDMLTDAQWRWLRVQLIDRPKWVANRVAVEQVAYLHSLKEPEPSPTMEGVGKLYADRAKITPDWKTKSKRIWREFMESVKVTTLRELTQAHLATYKEEIAAKGKSPTFVKHRFGVIKTIISYGKEWGLWPEDRTRALAFCTILVAPSSVSIDPDPMRVDIFHKLYAAADVQMRAILLMGLNFAMYAQDLADLKLSEIDLDRAVMATTRGKTGVPRIACLWPETVAAIRALPKWLATERREHHSAATIKKAFSTLRDNTEGVPATTVFNQLRDGAYTAAVESDGVDFAHAQALAGHRSGIADMYLKRRPKLVEKACAAIREHYRIESIAVPPCAHLKDGNQ